MNCEFVVGGNFEKSDMQRIAKKRRLFSGLAIFSSQQEISVIPSDLRTLYLLCIPSDRQKWQLGSENIAGL